MKKSATMEEKVVLVAKSLLKEFKSSENKNRIDIYNHFTSTSCPGKYTGYHMVFHGDKEVDFGEMSDEAFGSLTCRIADAICAKLKIKKNEIIHRDVREESNWVGSAWYSGHYNKYHITKKILLICPCKEFFAINKKLKALGLQEINFKDWYHCDVAGKRSSIFSRSYSYYAEIPEKCQKVLDYLKGKKKLTYGFVDCDDLEDRRRGEEYETEWYGSEAKEIQFKDSKGKTTTIY
jgi:hypothetical protein